MEGAERITDLTTRLVERVVTDGSGTDTNNKLVVYCMRILGSRMTPSVLGDEQHLSQVIQKKMVREHSVSTAAKFADLHRRLAQIPVLQQRWSIIYLLHMLSEPTTTYAAPALPPAPILETAFHSLGLDRLDSSTPHALETVKANKALEAAAPDDDSTTSRKARVANTVSELHNACHEVSEKALMRDVIFALQGIDGQYIKFDVIADGYTVDRKIGVLQPTRDLVQRICELGWLFGRVRDYVSTHTPNKKGAFLGLVGQSLCSALHMELSDYYRLIAILESQATSAGGAGGGVTMRRLFVWIQEPLERMKLMALIVDTCRGMKGGALASRIHSFLQHGDPAYRVFVSQLMKQICVPLFAMMRHWMVEGQLEDPFHEFFIAAEHKVSDEDMWHSKYRIENALLPSFITPNLAKKILQIGKAINFIRQSCKDSEWVLDSITLAGLDEGLSYGAIEALEAMVNQVAEKTNKHALALLFDKCHFREHCLAIKQFLLLGQGDFIQYLMDMLGPDLSKPANQLVNFRHNLTGVLESAIRASSAAHDNLNLSERLGVRIGQHMPGDEGWDVFSLEYRVDLPINTVLRKEVMESYLQLFNFLWRLKRIEYSLTSTWRRQMTSARLGKDLEELQKDFHKGHVLRNEMIHFINNLQYYMMFEVIESAWQELEADMAKAEDLDQLIVAHQRYIESLMERALLGSGTEKLMACLDSIFKLIIKFQQTQDVLYNSADELIQQHKDLVHEKQAAEDAGQWGPSTQLPRRMTSQAQAQLNTVYVEYEQKFSNFLTSLSEHVIKIGELQSIAFRLDFNKHYSTKYQMRVDSRASVEAHTLGEAQAAHNKMNDEFNADDGHNM